MNTTVRRVLRYVAISVVGVAVVVAIGYVAYTRFGIGKSLDQRAREAYAKAEMTRITGRMKDPSSVMFSGLFVAKHTDGRFVLCGSFNAKNSYGAYVGYRHFYAAGDLFGTDDEWGFMQAFERYCKDGEPPVYGVY